jgi:hypothetical protein
MGQKIPLESYNPVVDEITINYKGKFSLEGLYKMMHDWLSTKKYVSPDSADEKFEDYYFETILPGGTAKNHWIWWRTQKKYNDFFIYGIDVDFQTLVISSVEEVYKGVKVKLNDGELILKLKPKIIIDPEGRWTQDWFSELAYKHLYRKHYWALIEEREIDMYDQVYALSDKVKQYLGLITHNKLEKPFIPVTGYPYLVEPKQ